MQVHIYTRTQICSLGDIKAFKIETFNKLTTELKLKLVEYKRQITIKFEKLKNEGEPKPQYVSKCFRNKFHHFLRSRFKAETCRKQK